MSQRTFEQVLVNVQTLSSAERARLREILTAPSPEEQQQRIARELAQLAGLRDFSGEHQWLAEHRDEYAGQWVALMGNQLVSHGATLKEVRAAALAAGLPDALFVQVEPNDAPPFIL